MICSDFLIRTCKARSRALSGYGRLCLGDADGQNDLAVRFLPVAAGADASRADEVELVVNGVQEHTHVAQDKRAELAPLRRFGREPRVDVLLRFRDRPLSLDDQADHAQALFLVRQAQKRAGMALGQVIFAQRLQNGRRMVQDSQLVCDGGLALADAMMLARARPETYRSFGSLIVRKSTATATNIMADTTINSG